MEVNLRNFLVTGRFGDVSLGMSRAQIEERLRPPDARGGASRRVKREPIWKYGNIESHFDLDPKLDRLEGIFADDFSTPTGARAFEVEPWVLVRGASKGRDRNSARPRGIEHVEGQAWDDDMSVIRVGAGVGRA